MDFVWVVLGIAVVAVALYFAATLLFGPGEPPQSAGEDLASPLPEDRDLTAYDLRAAVLPVTARGYRMSDVDALIERMAQQLALAESPTPTHLEAPTAEASTDREPPAEGDRRADRSEDAGPPRTTQA